MNNNPNQPKEYDAVLGGQTQPPIAGVVLGGIQGVKRRLESPVVKVRVAALSDALNYGEAGLDLVIDALKDPALQVQQSAYRLLRQRGGLQENQVLLDYDPWQFFTRWEDWKIEYFDPQVGITDPVGTAYVVEQKSQLRSLLKNPQAKMLEALKCEIEDNYWNRRKSFEGFVNTLVAEREHLPNLKALFIGDSASCNHTDSKIYLCNLSLLLKAYPNLKLLHVRGRIGYKDNPLFKVKSNQEVVQIRSGVDGSTVKINPLKHKRLKTMIIETLDLNDSHLAEICQLKFPSLEYLELWLGRRHTEKAVQILKPIFSGQSCPNLAYLGLIKSEFTDALAKAVAKSSIIERLRILDLSRGTLSTRGVMALLDSQAINRLHTLNVSENLVRQNMLDKLSQLNCQLIAGGQFRERYYSVWE